jgi:hypothetical protein
MLAMFDLLRVFVTALLDQPVRGVSSPLRFDYSGSERFYFLLEFAHDSTIREEAQTPGRNVTRVPEPVGGHRRNHHQIAGFNDAFCITGPGFDSLAGETDDDLLGAIFVSPQFLSGFELEVDDGVAPLEVYPCRCWEL